MSDSAPGDRRPGAPSAPARGLLLAAAGTVLVVGILYHLGPAKVASGETGPTAAPRGATAVTSTTVVAAVATTSTTMATHDPSTVTVQVANGTPAPHAAGSLSSKLTSQGWKCLSPMDTGSTSTSAVYYAPGYSADATAVAQASGMSGAAVRPMSASPVTTSADLVVVIGSDLPGNSSG